MPECLGTLSQSVCSTGDGHAGAERCSGDTCRRQEEGKRQQMTSSFYLQSYLDTGHACGFQI